MLTPLAMRLGRSITDTRTSSMLAGGGRASISGPLLFSGAGQARLMRAVRYISLNPARARGSLRSGRLEVVKRKAHLAGANDSLVSVHPTL